jgi:tripartite-type tricarboxylate transporter receptor subunit TctC
MKTVRGILIGLALAMLSVSAFAQGTAGQAGAYPSRAVRLVVPYAAGGVSDIMGRALAQKMSELLGQPMVVDNRGGAGGTLGADIVAKSPPDGYTIVLTSLTVLAIAPNMLKSVPYDPVKDFSAIGAVAIAPNILTVNPSTPFQSLSELVAYAKANPGKLSFGSSGVGSIGHLSGEVLRISTGADLLHVPYKSAGLAYPDVISGRVSMVFDTLPSAIQHVHSGKVRPIAVLSDKRSPLLPDVPTFAEAGFPEATLRFWFGLHGPANMPPAIVQKLNDALTRALAAPDLRERFSVLGADPFPSSPQELADLTRSDVGKLAKTIKAAGIQRE